MSALNGVGNQIITMSSALLTLYNPSSTLDEISAVAEWVEKEQSQLEPGNQGLEALQSLASRCKELIDVTVIDNPLTPAEVAYLDQFKDKIIEAVKKEGKSIGVIIILFKECEKYFTRYELNAYRPGWIEKMHNVAYRVLEGLQVSDDEGGALQADVTPARLPSDGGGGGGAGLGSFDVGASAAGLVPQGPEVVDQYNRRIQLFERHLGFMNRFNQEMNLLRRNMDYLLQFASVLPDCRKAVCSFFGLLERLGQALNTPLDSEATLLEISKEREDIEKNITAIHCFLNFGRQAGAGAAPHGEGGGGGPAAV